MENGKQKEEIAINKKKSKSYKLALSLYILCEGLVINILIYIGEKIESKMYIG